MIDDGCTVEGYQSDITRTFVLGRATDKMKRVFDIEHAAQTAALKAARPGVEAQSVDAAARKVIEDAGFGPDYKFFSHRVGHGIGMDGHEWPYLVRGNTLKLQAGMTFSDEPGIYIPDEFGMRLEDDMHITREASVEPLTPLGARVLDAPFECDAERAKQFACSRAVYVRGVRIDTSTDIPRRSGYFGSSRRRDVDPHRDVLHHLGVVAGGVVGRQQRELARRSPATGSRPCR